MVTFALDTELLAAVDAWRAAQTACPSKTAVLEASLRMFLAAQAKKKR